MAGEGGARASIAYDGLLEPFPSWTELPKARTASLTVRRGRQDEFDRTGTGTATVLAHDTGALGLDPTAGGDMPTHGMLEIFNPVAGEWASIYRGHVEEDRHELDGSMIVVRSELQLVDALDYLAGFELAPDLHGHYFVSPEIVERVPAALPDYVTAGNIYYQADAMDDRIYAVLADAGWPVSLATIFSGNVVVQEVVYSPGTPALNAIQDAVDAEFPGIAGVWVSKDGVLTVHGRFARFNPDAYGITTWEASTGDNTGAQIKGLAFSRSRRQGRLVNAALSTPKGILDTEIAAVVRTDTASIDKYGTRSWSADELLTQYGQSTGFYYQDETVLFADYYVDNYSEPTTRIDTLRFRSLHPDHPKAADTWALIVGVELGDMIRVVSDHPGGGFLGDLFFVEGITYDVKPLNGTFADITLDLDVSPAGLYDANPF